MERPVNSAALAVLALFAVVSGSYAADLPYGAELDGFDYPHPVQHFEFQSQQLTQQMAYMDVEPRTANVKTAVLLHGKNFCGATWETTIEVLTTNGYRVIAPDQIGFCKSTKPSHYQYTFQQLARNTHLLLLSLGVHNATIIGHSTGGMLAVRYALMYPSETRHLVLVDPLGLEDWKAKGVPSLSIDDWYARELRVSAESIRQYELSTYYVGQWRPAYEKWVQMLAGLNAGPGKELVAYNSAALYDMIYTQPVLYEFPKITVPTVLMIGGKDTTAVGKDFSPPQVREVLGHYAELGRQAAAAIPGAVLIEFPELGHAPMLQDPSGFHKALLAALKTP